MSGKDSLGGVALVGARETAGTRSPTFAAATRRLAELLDAYARADAYESDPPEHVQDEVAFAVAGQLEGAVAELHDQVASMNRRFGAGAGMSALWRCGVVGQLIAVGIMEGAPEIATATERERPTSPAVGPEPPPGEGSGQGTPCPAARSGKPLRWGLMPGVSFRPCL